MRIIFTCWVLVLLALPGAEVANGQAPTYKTAATTPAELHFRTARNQLDQGLNAAALATLEPLAAPTAHFARAGDAAYLAAVAAGRLRQWPETEQLINLLRTEYPTYPNLAEALLLQGQALLEENDFDSAFKTLALAPLSTSAFAGLRDGLKTTYLPRLADRATWLRLLRRYPTDALVGRAYAERLGPGGLGTEADRTQLDDLVARFHLDPTRYILPVYASQKKSSYNVAVLLPFELADPSEATQRKNQFVTDLYAGLRLAQDSLQHLGQTLQLFAYDTGGDTLQLKKVLALPELAGMDLLVGPVYKSGAKLLARYARDHQIICVNPLSQDGDMVLDNPWHYLFGASAATQGRLAAQFAATAFGVGKPALLLHEDNKDDTDFANAYQTTYEALGGKIGSRRHFNSATDESLYAAFTGLDTPNSSHLVVVSDSRRVGPSAFAARTYTVPVPPPLPGARPLPPGRKPPTPATARLPLLVPGSWLDNPRLDLDQLAEPATYFVQPQFYDEQADSYRRFRLAYLQRQHLPPSLFAAQGFELLWFFGNALHQYGTNFQDGLAAAGPATGAVFGGQGYPAGSHDNQVVPITKVDDLEVKVVK